MSVANITLHLAATILITLFDAHLGLVTNTILFDAHQNPATTVLYMMLISEWPMTHYSII